MLGTSGSLLREARSRLEGRRSRKSVAAARFLAGVRSPDRIRQHIQDVEEQLLWWAMRCGRSLPPLGYPPFRRLRDGLDRAVRGFPTDVGAAALARRRSPGWQERRDAFVRAERERRGERMSSTS